MGEIGGNEFNYAFFGGMSIEEAKNLVPEVVQTIMNATRVRKIFIILRINTSNEIQRIKRTHLHFFVLSYRLLLADIFLD